MFCFVYFFSSSTFACTCSDFLFPSPPISVSLRLFLLSLYLIWYVYLHPSFLSVLYAFFYFSAVFFSSFLHFLSYLFYFVNEKSALRCAGKQLYATHVFTGIAFFRKPLRYVTFPELRTLLLKMKLPLSWPRRVS